MIKLFYTNKRFLDATLNFLDICQLFSKNAAYNTSNRILTKLSIRDIYINNHHPLTDPEHVLMPLFIVFDKELSDFHTVKEE